MKREYPKALYKPLVNRDKTKPISDKTELEIPGRGYFLYKTVKDIEEHTMLVDEGYGDFDITIMGIKPELDEVPKTITKEIVLEEPVVKKFKKVKKVKKAKKAKKGE